MVLGILMTYDQIFSSVDAHPIDNDCSCHVAYPYSINSTSPPQIEIAANQNFSILISATGPRGILHFHPDPWNNSLFKVYPNDTIADNSLFDLDPTNDSIVVNYTLTAPEMEGNYVILFFVREPMFAKPRIACMTFELKVGSPPRDIIQEITQVYNRIFNHMNIYLGTLAMLCLTIGTLLYEKDQMYVKAHGILATISLILTSINIYYILPETIQVFQYWNSADIITWFHLLHIILGTLGFIAAIYALILGFTGIRDKKPGYIALITWGINFISGLLIWGVNL
jgi:uncharacterized membrane protein YozB (DUF420 family)